MTSEEPTKTPAEIYLTGDSDTVAERQAEPHLWNARERAEAVDWGKADHSLDAAYHALGAEPAPEAAADDLGRRRHPIKVEADRRWNEAMGEE